MGGGVDVTLTAGTYSYSPGTVSNISSFISSKNNSIKIDLSSYSNGEVVIQCDNASGTTLENIIGFGYEGGLPTI